MTNIFGWRDSRDVTALSLADYTEDQAAADIQRFANDYTTLVAQLIGRLAVVGSDAKGKFGLGVGGRMQRYGEGGAVEATRRPATWDVAYPIATYRGRKLYTEEYLATVTMGDMEKDVIAEAVAYYDTLKAAVLNALMFKTNYNFDDGSERQFPRLGLGTLGVKRLCNADSAEGEVWVKGSQVSIAALQHYFGSNNASMTITPFETAYGKLQTVGQTDDVVALVATANVSTVKGFTGFYEPKDDTVVSPTGSYAVVRDARAFGALKNANVRCEVVEEPLMPTGYFFMYNRAGGDANKPVYIRQYPAAQFQGWKLVQDETRAAYGEKSLRNKQWQYVAGAGVRNRVNGVACQIVASTTYTDPAVF